MTSENATDFKSALRVGALSLGKLKLDTDWTSYTPTTTGIGFAGSVVKRTRYRVVGKTLHVALEYNQSAPGTHADLPYTFSLPTGCIALAPIGSRAVGTAYVSGTDSGTSLGFVGTVLLPVSTLVYVYYMSGPSTAVVPVVWGPTAQNAASLRGSAGTFLSVSLDFQVELDPASPILN